MAPAFGLVEARGLLPYFMDSVTKAREPHPSLIPEVDSGPCRQMADKWSNIIENGETGYSAAIDVNAWVGKATLDACVLVLGFCWRKPWTNREFIPKVSVQGLSTTTLVH